MAEPAGCIIELSGFPVGYFVVKNAASRCVFDVIHDNVKDGTELILYTEKEKTMVESEYRRMPIHKISLLIMESG
jgi:hypothetical protein